MFTGIIQGTATIIAIDKFDELQTLTLQFPKDFCKDLAIGASVSIDGVCLTVTTLLSPNTATFDVIMQTINVTTLSSYIVGSVVNVERAAKDGAEIGGHPLSGHIDFAATIENIYTTETNRIMRINIPTHFRKYIFARGYIAINGASLTVSEVNRNEGWFEVWLIPETRRVTIFEQKKIGDLLNIEIERNTQIVVDTVREAVHEGLGKLQPLLEAILKEKGLAIENFIEIPSLEEKKNH